MRLKAFESLIVHRGLIHQFTKREIETKYRGSRAGFIWTVVNPLVMLSIYTFVFSQIFDARWGNGSTAKDPIEFGLNLFTGLIVFNIFAESISRAPALINSNPNFVKKVIFPLEILGIAVIGSAVMNGLSGLAILLIFQILNSGTVNMTVTLIPFIWIPLILSCTGLVWAVASISVFIKDINNLINPVISVLMFMSPIFYPTEMIPSNIRTILELSPIALFITYTRELVLEGKTIPFTSVFVIWLLSIGWYECCFRMLKKLQPRFSDYL